MFVVGQNVVGHAGLGAVLESVKEIPVGYAIPAGLYSTAGQERRQQLLL